MSQKELEQLEPDRALKMYLESRRHELRESTIKSKRSRIGMFVDYCDEQNIEYLSDIDGIDIHQYRVEQADEIARRTLVSRLSDLRVFLEWAESVDAVEPAFHEKIQIPDVETTRSETLSSERAETILTYLRRFEYATRDHVVVRLFWQTGMRLGTLRSIDIDDVHLDGSYLELVHRPDSGTPLKNGEAGERPISINDGTEQIIHDYIENNRRHVKDDHDRDPLLTTCHGRPGIVTFRRTVYRYTRPCEIGEGCPHDRDIDDCEAAQDNDKASMCPSTVSPHDVRRGSITHLLRNDVPKPMVSDRCDVSHDVLEKHYDQRSDIEKMEQRRGYLDNL